MNAMVDDLLATGDAAARGSGAGTRGARRPHRSVDARTAAGQA
jgi:hypothetical protein